MLVGLVDCLSATSVKRRVYRPFGAVTGDLSDLSVSKTRQAPKFFNDFSACRLSDLSAPTEGFCADKRKAHPVGGSGNQNTPVKTEYFMEGRL